MWLWAGATRLCLKNLLMTWYQPSTQTNTRLSVALVACHQKSLQRLVGRHHQIGGWRWTEPTTCSTADRHCMTCMTGEVSGRALCCRSDLPVCNVTPTTTARQPCVFYERFRASSLKSVQRAAAFIITCHLLLKQTLHADEPAASICRKMWGIRVSQVKPSNCFRRLEKLILPSIFRHKYVFIFHYFSYLLSLAH